MSSTVLLPGASRVIKLTPNNSLIPSPISSMDNLFDISLLSDAKFASWRSLATAAGKIGVVENGVQESLRFIDTNYNIATPEGNVWFLGKSEQDYPYYLQTGASLSRLNSTLTFPNYFTNHGFHEASLTSVDRMGNKNAIGSGTAVHSQVGIIGKAFGFLNAAHMEKVAYTPDITEVWSRNKLTLSLLLKDNNIASGYTIFLSHHKSDFSYYAISISNLAGTMYISSDFSAYVATLNYSALVSNGVPYLLTMVFDGTQTDSNINIQNAKRFKVFIDETQASLTFLANVPSTTWVGDSGAPFWIGTDGYTFNGTIDEACIIFDSWDQGRIFRRYNQIFNKATFWTPTIQPVITEVVNLGDGRWQLTGSGFIPEATDPIGEINGVACTIESASDTVVTIEEGIGTPSNNKLISLTNSDSETVNYLTGYPFTNTFGNSPFKFGF